MFRRRWKWFGRPISDQGFSISYGHRSVNYKDNRGVFQFGFEDGWLFPAPHQVGGDPVSLDETEIANMVDRVRAGIEFDGHTVRVWTNSAGSR